MEKLIEDGSLERLEDQIRERAYRLWEEEGRPEGRAEIHWQKARALIEGEHGHARAESARAEDSTPREISESSVDEQLDESFPASDAPSYTAGERVGAPDRTRAERGKKRR